MRSAVGRAAARGRGGSTLRSGVEGAEVAGVKLAVITLGGRRASAGAGACVMDGGLDGVCSAAACGARVSLLAAACSTAGGTSLAPRDARESIAETKAVGFPGVVLGTMVSDTFGASLKLVEAKTGGAGAFVCAAPEGVFAVLTSVLLARSSS